MRRVPGVAGLLVVLAVGCGRAGPVEEAVPVVAPASAASGPLRPSFEKVDGGRFELPGPGECKAVVLVFVGHDCPISNGYAPEVGSLCREFEPKGVAFCLVYADGDLEQAEAARHAREHRYPCPAVLDPGMRLARQVGARVKPEAAVLSPAGEVLYLGRIDDRYVDYGKKRAEPTRRDLRLALEAVLAGEPVTGPRTEAIGCDIDLGGK